VGSDLAEFDRLWIHGLSNDVAARTSFVNPSSAIVTAVNSPTFLQNVGYQGNGATSYLNTNYNPSTQGVKYTLNNASGFAYVGSNIISIGAAFGSVRSGAVGPIVFPQFSSLLPLYVINDGGTDNYGTGDSLGLSSVIRTSSTSLSLYKNGTLNASATKNSTSIPSFPLFICGYNNSGVLGAPYAGTISATGFGSANINQTNFYNAIQALGTSIGWAV
jgi:hypothetical protein